MVDIVRHNTLLDDLDLVVVEVDDPALVMEGGTAAVDAAGWSVSISISVSGSVSLPSGVTISVSATVSGSYSWSYPKVAEEMAVE